MNIKCWELEKCGKKECPVYKKETDRCWLVSGTHCRDEIQGMFLNKIEICLKCAVFKNNVSMNEEEWWKTLNFADRQFKQYVSTIEEQRNAIMQLSTPVIPVWDSILILPLIGVLDEARAEHVINNLLEKISSSRAKVAIVDITGVAKIDAPAARHLIKTAKAAELMKCTCIFSGINPQNAVALTDTGIDLSRIITYVTLQDGLQEAFRLTNKKLTDV